jgi:hypothetical protein
MLIWPEYPWQVAPQQSLLPFVPVLKSNKLIIHIKLKAEISEIITRIIYLVQPKQDYQKLV